jgi:multiple sugar transport system substrate-binding protein
MSLWSRRQILASAALASLAAPILAACGQSAPPSPTSAPKSAAPPAGGTAAPTAAAKSDSAAKPAAASPTTAAKAAAPAKSSAKTPVSIAVRTEAVRTWQEDTAKKYAQEHPELDVQIVQVPYADMEKKVLTFLATNTMPDVIYSGGKWFSYAAYKGAFYALDDLVKTDDPGMDDFFKDSVEGSSVDGKLYALPHEINTGNTNIILYNKDLLAEKGVKEPTDTWTFEEYVDSAKKLTDASKNVWGSNLLTNNYYDLATWARTLGGDILSDDGKQFTLTTDPKTLEAARWITELHTVHKVAPARNEAEGLAFPAGQIALFSTGIYNVIGMKQAVADKFQWDAVLAPVGPEGLRGYELFLVMYSMAGKTKQVDVAYDLLKYMSSKETAIFSFVEQGQTAARKSVWEEPAVQKLHPIFPRTAAWVSDGKNEGPFPMPYNLRFSEFQDKFGNLSTPVYYGEVGFDEGTKKLQEECQAIVALPRS